MEKVQNAKKLFFELESKKFQLQEIAKRNYEIWSRLSLSN